MHIALPIGEFLALGRRNPTAPTGYDLAVWHDRHAEDSAWLSDLTAGILLLRVT
jgi:hypothetical protein